MKFPHRGIILNIISFSRPPFLEKFIKRNVNERQEGRGDARNRDRNSLDSDNLNEKLMDCRATEGGLAPDAAAGAGAGAGSDGIVGGPRTPQQIASQKRLQATQAQVDEVVDIMKTNVEKVLERDQKLSELDDRAGKIHVIHVHYLRSYFCFFFEPVEY